MFVSQLSEIAPLLARHYSVAEEDAKTIEYATRAGDAAARIYANAEALEHYALAIQASKRSGNVDSEKLIHLFTQRGRVLEVIGRYDDALANYEEMETYAHERNDRALELGALIARAAVYTLGSAQRNPEKAQSLSDQALALARELGDHKAEAKILWNLLFLNTYQISNPKKAIEYGEESLKIAREYNLREQMAYTLHNLGYARVQTGNMRGAVQAHAEARELWRALDKKDMLADNLAVSSMNEILIGRTEDALSLVEEAYSINQAIGSPWGLAMSRLIQGNVCFELLQPARSLHAHEDCIRIGEGIGAAAMVLSARCLLSWSYAWLGAFDQAIAHGTAAIEYARKNFETWEEWPRAVLTRAFLLEGNLAEAESASGIGWHAPINAYFGKFIPPGAMTCVMAKGELAFAQRKFESVIEQMDELVGLLQSSGMRYYVPDALYLKGQALRAQDSIEPARSIFDDARREAEAVNARNTLWQILIAQSEIEKQRGRAAESDALRTSAREIVETIAEAEAVTKNTDAYLASLSDADLDRIIDLSVAGLGKQSVAWVLGNLVAGHLNNMLGEISVLKGVQGVKGYPW